MGRRNLLNRSFRYPGTGDGAAATAAEKFSTLSALVNPRLVPEDGALKRLWNNMVLYDEHTWGADRSVSNPASQETTAQVGN